MITMVNNDHCLKSEIALNDIAVQHYRQKNKTKTKNTIQLITC